MRILIQSTRKNDALVFVGWYVTLAGGRHWSHRPNAGKPIIIIMLAITMLNMNFVWCDATMTTLGHHITGHSERCIVFEGCNALYTIWVSCVRVCHCRCLDHCNHYYVCIVRDTGRLTISLSIIVHSLSLSSSRHRALRTNGAMVMVPAGVIYYSFFISPFVVRHILHNYFFCSRRNQCIERSTTAIGLCDHSHSRHHCKYMQFTEIPGYNKNGL